MSGGRTRYRINSLLTGALLVVLTVLAAWLTTRYPVQWDWTRSGRHTLSPASVAILEQAPEKLEVTAYAREQTQLRNSIRRFIDKYQRVKPDISLHFVNPDAVPNKVRRLGIKVNGEMVLRYDGRSEHVRRVSEREFTHAVQRLIRGGERWLAFVEGHGERDPLGQANHDLSQWAQQLHSRGFQFQSLSLGETGTIPDNTAVLIIASPLMAYLPGEVAIIKQYLAAGGNLLWLRDPDEDNGLGPLAEYLQLEFEPGTIIDTGGRLIGIDDPTITMITPRLYGDHPVLKDFSATTLFPGAVSLQYRGERWESSTLLTSGDHTWLETGEMKDEVAFDQGTDRRGPLTIGLALEGRSDEDIGTQRIIVVGDGDFLANTYIGNGGNMELGTRLINWLSSDDDLVDIPAHVAGDTRLQGSAALVGYSGLFFLIALPLLLLGAGALIWWRQKKR